MFFFKPGGSKYYKQSDAYFWEVYFSTHLISTHVLSGSAACPLILESEGVDIEYLCVWLSTQVKFCQIFVYYATRVELLFINFKTWIHCQTLAIKITIRFQIKDKILKINSTWVTIHQVELSLIAEHSLVFLLEVCECFQEIKWCEDGIEMWKDLKFVFWWNNEIGKLLKFHFK